MNGHTKYVVSLTEEEKEKLSALSTDRNLSNRLSKRISILLTINEQNITRMNYCQIAENLHVAKTTVVRVAKDYAQGGLEYAISSHYNPTSARMPKVNKEIEAYAIALACSAPPKGRRRWSLELLKEEVNKKELGPPISRETVRLLLKKADINIRNEKG
ncbi:helix-turn-helix domain-containing protein [Diplocloster agilis]|uniref:helix-turn-helix domain-containing protein n=1 Tax=Diplocloster agilis TaxID=2850323 RepID=UPI0008231C89|nr:helix-turn-helix domain-containing protein [Suonthocola fibrivorans]MCU6735993.1 helix-turn-helix domain-containing protein [Suonthocola fibrivorans]SCJ84995.1 Uncharacterised protein [uncultured Clostridium sp.]